MDREELIARALEQAARLEGEMVWKPKDGAGYGGFWTTHSPEADARLRAHVTAALELLRRYAGSDSEWTRRAQIFFDGGRQSMASSARDVSELVRGWAEQARSGVIEIVGIDAWEGRSGLSTDLLEQARQLLEDKSVHPAAPVMLVGAALEIALRGMVESLGLERQGRPGINAYAEGLRAAGVLSRQDLKDVQQVAGLRNDVAHGDFDSLSRERASLMEQQVNLLLARLRPGDE